MEIRCPACNARYNLDERSIGPTGIHLTCSACDATFRVRLPPSAPPERKPLLRKALTGEVFDASNADEVRRLILDRVLGPADLFSEDGHRWERLDACPDYIPYILAVEQEKRQSRRGALPPRADGATHFMQERELPIVGVQGGPTLTMHGLKRDVDPYRVPTPHAARGIGPALDPPRADYGAGGAARGGARSRHTSPPVARASHADDAWEIGTGPLALGSEPGDGFVERATFHTSEVAAIVSPGTRWLKRIVGGVALILVGAALTLLAIHQGWIGAVALPTSDHAVVASDSAATGQHDGPANDEAEESRDDDSAGAAPSSDEASEVDAPAEVNETIDEAVNEAVDDADEGARDETRDAESPEASAVTAATPAATSEAQGAGTAERERAPTRTQASGFDATMARGRQALESGRSEDALSIFGDLAGRSNRAEAHVGAGDAYRQMGRHDLAALRYQSATRANPRYLPAWLSLAQAHERNGDTRAAIDAYERVIEIRAAGREADLARRALERLQ